MTHVQQLLPYFLNFDDTAKPQFIQTLIASGFVPSKLKTFNASTNNWETTPEEIILQEILTFYRTFHTLPNPIVLSQEIQNKLDLDLNLKAQCITLLHSFSKPSNPQMGECLWLMAKIEEAYTQCFLADTLLSAGATLQDGNTSRAISLLQHKLRVLNEIRPHKEDIQNIVSASSNLLQQYKAGTTMGVYSGLPEWDQQTGGFYPEQIIVIAGRPKRGKSLLGKEILRFAYNEGKTGVLFNREMSYTSTTRRWLAADLGIRANAFKHHELTPTELQAWEDLLQEYRNRTNTVYLVGPSRCATPLAIETELEKLSDESKIDIAVVDYLGLLQPSDSTVKYARDEKLGVIMADLKELAIRFRIPILVIAQINRPGEDASLQTVNLTHLSDSDKIGQHADAIWMMVQNSEFHNKIGIKTFCRDSETLTFSIKVDFPRLRVSPWQEFEMHPM